MGARILAAERGEVHYAGAPCRKCKCRMKYTSSGQCVECTKERAAENLNRIRKLLKEAKASA